MLIPAEEVRAIGEKVLSMTEADDAVVNVGHERSALTRVANNSIALNVFTESRGVSVTVAFGNRKGEAGCSSVEEDDLRAMVRRAEEIARVAPPPIPSICRRWVRKTTCPSTPTASRPQILTPTGARCWRGSSSHRCPPRASARPAPWR